MYQIGKIKNKQQAFSLVEILISLAIFSAIITTVMVITLSMINAQKKVQAKLYLTQSAQTTLESMSRQIRYGYTYTGNTQTSYDTSEAGQTIYISTVDTTTVATSTGSTTAVGASSAYSQNLVNESNSPFILFESQDGNPNSYTDQNAFCAYNGKLYKVNTFSVETDGQTYKARCDSGQSMLPPDIVIEKIAFDVYGDDSENPKNPMVRIKMRLKHEEGGVMDIQTTVTQRLVTHF
jgi:type II secretory pathway pseudopilin PulG